MSTRILLFTGKGGVGKTTTSAATALRCADAGLRTMVLSTDPAHSLADAFGIELGNLPVEVASQLWGQQLDAQARMEESWAEIQAYLMEVFDWAGVDAIEAEELAVLPGLDEVFALTDIKSYATSGEWDVVVVDCAPTAETIRFLSLPDILAWYMQRLFPMSRRVNKAVGPVLRRVTNLPVAGDNVFAAGHRFYDRLDGVRELLTDADTTSVRLVVNPERMVIAEARRTYTYLSLFGYRVDAVVANRLLPEAITDPWFDRWRALHAEHLKTIEESFAPLPVLRAELADDLDLGRKDDELLIRVGPYRRAVLLPDSLRRREITSATLKQGKLRVVFAGNDRVDAADGAQGGSRWQAKTRSPTGRARASTTSRRRRKS